MGTRGWVRGLVVLAAMVAVAAGPCWADLDDIQARGTLRVLAHFDPVRPEFFAISPGARGLDYEILDGFAALHKVKLEVVEVTGGSDVRMAALLAGKGDVVAGRFAVLPERARRIAFTTEVFPARFVMVTRKPTPVITSPADLKRYRVGTVRTSQALVDLLKAAEVPASQIDDGFREPSEFMDGLRTGRVAAFVIGVDAALPAQKEDPAIQIGGFIGAPGSLAFGVRKEDVKLLKALDQYITNLRRTPTWSRLVVKYFGEAAVEVLRTSRGGRQ